MASTGLPPQLPSCLGVVEAAGGGGEEAVPREVSGEAGQVGLRVLAPVFKLAGLATRARCFCLCCVILPSF